MDTPLMTIWIFLSVIGIFMMGGAVFITSYIRKSRKVQVEQQQEIYNLNQLLNGLCSGAVGVDRRVTKLEQHERELHDRQEQLSQLQTSDQPYGDAILNVRQGLPVDGLVERYGFSRTEADLLVRLHSVKKAS